MSISGISIADLFNGAVPGSEQTQLIRNKFQQLEQDLQSGSLSAAQSDSTALDHDLPQLALPLDAKSNNPLANALNQLSQDLQGGNLSAAQQDCATVQQYFQETGVEALSSRTGGSGPVAGQLQQMVNQPGILRCGILSRPQTLSVIQQGMQRLREISGLYSARNSLPRGSRNLSLLV